MAKMKAAVFVECGRIVLEEKPIPDIGPLDALMRVTTTTICGTDVPPPLNPECRRKIEMTPGAQSRNDTPPAAEDTPSAIRHHCHTLGLGGGVKGQSRRLPVRTAQPLRPSPGPSTIEQPCEPAEPLGVVSRDCNRWAGRSQRASRGQDQR
jgi:hypothetical protein